MDTFYYIKYAIYVHCWKIYNLFARALETGRKANRFTASAN